MSPLLQDEKSRKRLRSLRIAIVAIAAFPMIYIAIGTFYVRSVVGRAYSPASDRIIILIYAIAAVMALLGFFMPVKKVASVNLPPASERGIHDKPDNETLRALVSGFFKTSILRAVLFESMGLCGLAGCLMTGDSTMLFILNVLAALFIALHFPGDEKFSRFVDQLYREDPD